MGNIIYDKTILLDERDIDGTSHGDIQSLAVAVFDKICAEFGTEGDLDSGIPFFELNSMCSERFGSTCFYDWSEPQHPLKREAFNSALASVIGRVEFPDMEALLREDVAVTQSYVGDLKAQICEHAMAGDAREVELLAAVLDKVQQGRLPGIKPRDDTDIPFFPWDREDGVYDFRKASYGAGKRLLVYVGYDWGQ